MFCRETLRLIKKIAFEQLKPHRFGNDVRNNNWRAQNLYKAEGFIKNEVIRKCILYSGSELK